MLTVTFESKLRRWVKAAALVCLLFLPALPAITQESSIDNQQGLWSDNATWSDATAPATFGIDTDVHIYGHVISGSDLDFGQGDLFIHDTLTIFGSLTLADTLELHIDPAGILIVRGDFTAGDTVDVFSSGQMVVTGNFTILGDNDQGSWDNDGQLYVFDPAPGIKTGTGYGDFTCVNPVDSCTLYDESDLLASPLAGFYLSAAYEITPGGSTSFCLGDSVLLSVSDTATAYAWYLDDVLIPGATTHEYYAKSSGDVHALLEIGVDTLQTPKVTITVNTLPVVALNGAAASYCEGGATDTLVGSPLGGMFLAGPGLTLLGAGDSAVFDPALAGNYTFKYYYTDGNSCTDTATAATIVNPLPVVALNGAAASYCEGGATDTLVGSPLGGMFLAGPGLTLLGAGDSAVFDPALAGNYTFKYYYTDGNSCTDTATAATIVNPLPVVALNGAAASYCEGGATDTLVGSPLGGFFVAGPGLTLIGVGDSAVFDPALAGNYTFKYYYTDGNSCTDTATAATIVNPLPAVALNGAAASYCEGGVADTLVGSPLGGMFLAGPGLTLIGVGDSAVFDPALAGNYTFKYYYTDGNSCTDTATAASIVNPLPVVALNGAAASYCEGGATDTLVGSPLGGFFLAGPGLTLIGVGDSAVFDPALAGNYTFKYYYTDGNSCTDTATAATIVNPLPVVGMAPIDPFYCQGGIVDTLVGSPLGGSFVASTGLTLLGVGDSALFNPPTDGNYTFKYYYTDGNACTDTFSTSTVVHPKPVISFSGLALEYCFGDEQDTLIGSEAGGSYTGTGISDNADGTAYFNPSTVGTYDINYYYTDVNTCSDTATQSVTVHALPVVDYMGLPTDLCVQDPAQTLTGSQAPEGSFFGGTVVDNADGTGTFTPILDGSYDIYYTYADPNGCRDTVMHSVDVHPLPVVTIGIYDLVWDVNDPAFAIAGAPLGGTFTGKGISGTNYDPALAGRGMDTVVYAYTDGNLCTNYDTIIFEIRDYDFKFEARILDDIDNWCSPEAAYTTSGATADETNASCWAAGPNNNRWFVFQATTSEVFVEVKSGGTEGTNRNPQLALWQADGTELACQRYWDSNYNDISMGYVGLTPGDWYYISVDNYPGRQGSFTLCVDDEVDYDFLEGAIVVPHTNDWRSADAEYTTRNATADRNTGSCWNRPVNSNRWFTFTALKPTVTVDVLIGGVEGTQRYTFASIWNEAGDEVACVTYSSQYGDVRMSTDTLTVGKQYYISVDHYNSDNYDGTFTLAVDDEVDYDYQAGAVEMPHTGGWRSADAEYTTLDATSDGPKGSCWNNGPNFTRWFKFQATTTEVTAELLTGGTEGTIRNPFLVLVDTFGTELACARYYSEYSDIKLGYAGLTPGEWYYVIADNHGGSTSYRGTFTMTLDNIVDYDFKVGAYEIADPHNWCSLDAEFTTINASPDEFAGSCWPNGPNYNRWFKFTATTNEVMVQFKTGGDQGTLRHGLVALWDDVGTELACGRYSSAYSDINMGYSSLTPGNTYYISVDNYVGLGYRGTFTLCVDDEVDYDYPEGAKVLSDLNNWCSADAAYTTMDATGDTLAGSCWPNGPNYDRWFKFQATTNEVLVRMMTGGDEGTLRNGLVAIWDSSFNQVACNRYTSTYSDVSVGSAALTPGDWYFISVDNYSGTGYRGTFSLCITDNVDYDFREGAHVIADIDSYCSLDEEFTTLGATSDQVAGSCWPNGPNFNRWFTWQAVSTEAFFNVQTGGAKGTMRYGMAAIYDTLGNEISCARYASDYDDIEIGATGLTPGEWYYLQVDNYANSAYRGTFTLCSDDEVDYDYKLGAEILTDIDGWCSAQEAYTTIGATPDEAAGSCWPNGPNYNRWFAFQATSTMVNATVHTGGGDGTARYMFAALWDSLGNELVCNRYASEYTDVHVGYTSLVPGDWYYISVDNYSGTGYRGTFTLCVDDTVDYDYPEAAIVIPSIVDYCSAEEAFTTIGASGDHITPVNWPNGPNYNRWFRFQATASGEATISVKIGGTEGTMRYPYLALWDTTLTELASRSYVSQYDDLEIAYSGLTPGEWYFVSVDNRDNAAYRGTFTLCIDDEIGYDFFAGAIEITDLDNWCSDYAIYSTVSATGDESMGSCWPNGPNYNRWFRFQATSTDISLMVRTGGIEGSVRRPDIALFDTLKNQLACARWVTDYGDEEIYFNGLTVGEWYYFTVDNASGGTQGSFSICATDNLANDDKANATIISDLNNWCSDDARFTNSLATADETQGSCWGGATNKNVWFTFQATSTRATVTLTTGGDYGQMVNQQMALWDAVGTELACEGPFAGQGELTMLATGMTIGDWYYLSVDDDLTPGTFTLCVDDTIDYDVPEGAFEISDPGNWCSPNAAFSNATADPGTDFGSCWDGTDYRNAWFSFVAPSSVIEVHVKTGTVYGTMDRQQIVILNENLDEVACAGPDINEGVRSLQIDSLTVGNRYYIAVDNGESSGGNTGTFSICTDTILSYDFRAGAEVLSHNFCSAEAAYTLVQATADGNTASCWGGSELTNVWFRFQATTPYVTVTLKTDGIYGDLRRGQMALWNANGDEVACRGADILEGTMQMISDTLTVGNWYWISVDMDEDQSYDRLGTFTLCLEDALDYDFQGGAIELNHNEGCSAEAAYSNALATDDGGVGTCWGTSNTNKNVWFVFQANTPHLKVELQTGNVYGSMRRGQMAVFNALGEEVACTGDILSSGTTVMLADTLTVGDWYWISVDDDQTSGTFTLCLYDELDFDYFAGAHEIPHDYGCSTEAEFTNFQATEDLLPGSCWGTSNTLKNVWFKFQATTSNATVRLRTGNIYGSMRRGQMAMFNESLTEVACVGDIVDQGINEMVVDSLTIGNWYYIAVDDDYASGTFTFCLDDELSFDYRAGAEVITHDMGCSADAAYTSYYATADETPGSCWGTYNGTQNVWFTFQATSRFLTFELKTGNVYGSMRRGQMALFNAAGDEVACVGDVVDQGTTTMNADTLTPGNWYWVSIDDDYRSGTFTICSSDEPTYDFWEGAKELLHDQGCSSDAAYSNLVATPDLGVASCWATNNSLKNVWFKFQATTTNVTAELKTGSIYGNMRRGQMAIWNEAYVEVACVSDVVDQGTTTLSIDSLTIGNWYYIAVDDDYSSGSFTLCLSDQATYDFFNGARVLSHNGGCSADAEYSNTMATADQTMGSCWTGIDPDDNKNVWFTFQAVSTEVAFTLRNYNVYGNMRYPQAALWTAGGVELKCMPRTLDRSTHTLSYDGLTIGDWYYLSVDDAQSSGTFTLCIDDQLDYDYKGGAYDITNPVSWCSSDAQFNNYYGTPDEMPGSCWAGGTNQNMWFKFTAISENVRIEVKNGTTQGSLTDLQAALWNEAGDEYDCFSTEGNTTNIILFSDSLTIGDTYYISVDDSQSPGTFTLCVDADPLNAELVGVDVSCNGLADGSITVNPEGGTGFYSYAWTRNSVPYVGGSSISGLDPATYEVTVRDQGTGITVVKSYTVTEDPALTLSMASSDASCPGDLDGSATATPGGGSGMGFSYIWYRNDILISDVTQTITGLDSAEYKVVATDVGSPTCTITDSVVVSNVNSASSAPTGITVANDSTCQGTQKILSVNGGSLGTGANWIWSTDPGFGSTAGIGTPVNVDPAVNRTYYVRAEGTCNTTGSVNGLVQVLTPSTAPLSINVTNDNTCVGVNKTLTVVGGALGDGAEWEWYTDAGFTSNVGSGLNLVVDPLINTTYYVRAEGDCGATAAVNISVTVRTPSTDPTGISVANDNSCPGTIKTLGVLGGSLGTGADWYWYSDATFSTLVGSGVSVTVDPLVSTTYYVRAQGDCGNSNAASQLVTVLVPSTDPTTFSISNNNSCPGTPKTLTVVGGSLGDGADWYWYADAAFVSLVGTGNSIAVDPASTTTYYLRAEGTCGNTAAVNNVVQVTVPSTDPTGITVSADNICPGDGSILTVQGGSLGTGASWEWYTDATFTTSAGSGASINVTPAVTTTYYVRAEGDCNNSAAVNSTLTVKVESTDPTGVAISVNDICPGDATTLSVVGGSLGTGASWEWYTDATLTTNVGSGASLNVTPAVTTTYYVRAEGDCNNSASVNNTVTVKVESVDPTGINISTDNICPGDGTTLTVQGGSLGDGASWEWYTDAGFGTSAGSGLSITVNPLVTTTYYVRAEGDCNNSGAVSTTVTVKVESTDPTNITISADDICPGDPTTLSVVGGSLGTGASWEWYTNAGLTTSAGSGASITVNPAVTTTYYVRAEGDCNNSAAINNTVTVKVESVDPTGVNISVDNICPGDATTLSVVGGSLGTGASWEWYSDAGFSSNVGSGASISVTPAVTTTYYVRAEGDCNNSAAASNTVTVKVESSDPTGITISADNICPGDPSTLSVQGGSLGTGASWEWYTDATFTTSAGSGASINVTPAVTTTYYVRAEGDCNNSAAVNSTLTVKVESTDPTGVAISVNDICPGDATTLSVVGGSLGTGATWEWYTDATLTTNVGSGASLNVTPAVTTTYYVRAEGDCNNSASVNNTVTVKVESVDPTGINISTDNICPGDGTTLTVQGGSLGDGASWEWYTDAGFGTSAGSGLSITVNPLVTTTYYVRAEGDCNNSGAVSTTVTVKVESTDPTNITISADDICPGDPTTLSVVGGSLGTGASWEWYTNAGLTTSAGSGASITVNPAVTTTYYVRAEGDCNNSAAINNTVTVKVESVDPTGVNISVDNICPGDATTLSVVGGSLGTGATWEWYSDAGFSSNVGSGASISVTPAVTTTYYVRAEGDCNNSAAASNTVTVKVESVDPTGITISADNICPGDPSTLSVQGGSLGTGASWEWYTDATFTTSAGSGASINVTPAVTTTYYVRAEGDCNNSAAVNSTLTVKVESSDPTGINISADNICPGDPTTLTVLGGSLGTGATWEWYTDATFLTSAGSGVSITVNPAVSTTYYVRAEGDCNTSAAVSSLVTVKTESVAPTGIAISVDDICPGDPTTLTVQGGSLGTGATWEWYTDAAFTSNVGSGNSITVNPAVTTTYYVRAEGDCNNSAAANNTVTVKIESTDPTGISISANNICPGDPTTLSVIGGSLGTGANWEWYTDAGLSITAGSGASITVNPAVTTTYYVRAEGDCNSSAAVNSSVTVKIESADPSGINIGTNNICPGDPTSLSVIGGSLGTGASWEWYTDAGFSSNIGSGASISVTPVVTTTYYVRAEGDCNNSAAASNTVTVKVESVDPTSIIIGTDNICPGDASILTVQGGSLGTGATWEWYTDATFTTSAGNGASITVTPAVTTTYYVRAEGDCNNSAAVNSTLTVKVESTDPTGVAISVNDICPGDATTLSVVGGSLGTGASWEWYSDATLTTNVGSGASLSVSPAVTTTYYVRAEGDCNNSATANNTVTVKVGSVDPTGISISADNICPGDPSTLTVQGGSLGTGATWEWYTDAGFGTSAGSGLSITVNPLVTTTYYVRAEGDCNNSAAVSSTLTVKIESSDPTGITISADNICPGDPTTLSVVGGSLGTGASWEWYTDAALTASAGSGASITVNPAVTTTYYVRAEGDCNNSADINNTVTVKVESTDPTGINISVDNICPGDASTLTVQGGSLGTGASWEWYTDATFTTSAGSGASISVTPAVTTTYYVRAEGDCNNSAAASNTLTVKVESTDPTGIAISADDICPGDPSTLTVQGGSLGTGASWEWYTDATFTTSAGSGASITVSPAVTTTYYVRAEGDCNNSAAVNNTLTVKVESSNPTGVAISVNDICPGDPTTLSVQGGSLGTGATWEWYSDATFTSNVGSGASITVNPAITTTYYVRAEGDCNSTASANNTVTVKIESTDPTGITISDDNICPGDPTTLSVQGGSLGTGATWEWYSDASFGTSAGSGAVISVSPAVTTTYYVRAEGDCNSSNAASTTVTVKVESTDPTGITISADNICPGDPTSLTVQGGSLGTGATWEWYTDATFATNVGSGSSITVNPAVSTLYYVRAEGDCNNSGAVVAGVTVKIESTDPTGITISDDNICPGDPTTLSVVGGSLGTGASWEWYSDAGFTNGAGSGAVISVSPAVTTTYYVRAEGDCNNSNAASTTVTVKVESTDPTGITLSADNICPGDPTTLSVQGGSLGTGASWEWYTDATFATNVGSGSSITVSPAVSTLYYVRAEGDCNNSGAVVAGVTVKIESTDPTGIDISVDNICPGDATTLSVQGGSLGTGASWEWYSDAGLTTNVGSGASLSVTPALTTAYYVRAEGDCNNTASVTTTVTVKVESVDPTGINISVDNICPGDPTTLTVQGGSLGTGASWQWYTDAGFGSPAGTGLSITVNPAVTTTYYVRAEGDCNNSAAINNTVNVKIESVDPTGISISADNICPGDPTTLSVLGGSLGTGATWEWYTDATFSTSAGSGASITVNPAITTTYYVRAEGDCNTSVAANSTVTVKTESTDPTGINVGSDNICPGDPSILSVLGGSLGTGATWEWYSDAGFSTSVGSGAIITVNPAVTTTYYVRAEGDCNNSASVSATVTVKVESTDPTGITVSSDNICPGESSTLTVQGGSLGTGASWEWYTDATFTSSAGSGASITVTPALTTVYYVRAEGDCNNSGAVFTGLTVKVESTDPTGIAISVNDICPGDPTTLTVQGGSLGTGATWEWYSDAALSISAGSGPSITVNPVLTSTYYVRAEGDCNNSAAVNNTVTVKIESVDPVSISVSDDNFCPGGNTTLSVQGGSLGTGASWEWYSDAGFSNPEGSGASITVSPVVTTTYYVRAEGDCNNTAAANTEVTVKVESTNPTGISISANNICPGEASTLSVLGGSLGTGASWEWYSDAALSISAGSGPSISVTPAVSSTYYVRAEGDCNNSSSVSITLTVKVESTDPTGINISADNLCPGDPTTLTVLGGSLGTGAEWEWYSDAGFGSNVGSGSSVTLTPALTTTYYVRAEGDCNNSNAVSTTITVKVESVAPTGIVASANDLCPGESTTLTLQGGSLGTGASWQWYDDPAFTTSIGTGTSITVTPPLTATYYVRAEGDCNNTAAAQLTVNVKVESTDPAGIIISANDICPGDITTLSVDGGSLGTGASWEWYSDATLTTNVGSGASVSLNPAVTTVYYVRAEGDCNNSITVHDTVRVKIESTDPTGIDISADNLCPGDSTVLTVQGGSLGTGASWEWYSDAGFGTPVGSGESITVIPPVTTSYYVRAEGDCNNSAAASTTITVKVESTDPTGILISDNDFCPGLTATLSVQGGSLGTGAAWEWYSDSALTVSEGSGATISVTPLETTTYFLRAEGDCNLTSVISDSIVVKVESTDPQELVVSIDSICPGDTTVLAVQGGSLGTGASWVWYMNVGTGVMIGTGEYLEVNPDSSTRYYVRAEGDCNITAVASNIVTVKELSTDPANVAISRNNICPGDSTELRVQGGSLGTGAEWVWYNDPGLTSIEGTGNRIYVHPVETSMYWVRAEGDCHITNAVSGQVDVKIASIAPDSAWSNLDAICLGQEATITLSYAGGLAGDGAEAYWYDHADMSGASIATGNDVVIPAPLESTTYYVRYEGECNTTEAVSTHVRLLTVPAPGLSGDTVACTPEQDMYAVDGMAGSSFAWSLDGGAFVGDSTGEEVEVLWTGEGLGTLYVVETSMDGCVGDTASLEVTKYSSPVSGDLQTADLRLCSRDTGSYALEGLPGSSFAWSHSAGEMTENYGDSIRILWNVPAGLYQVSVVETTVNGCTGDAIQVDVEVLGVPVNLEEDPEICADGEYVIDLSGQFASYRWSDGSTGAVYTSSVEGWIGVAVVDSDGCTDADSTYLTVHDLPVVDLGEDTYLCGEEGLVLNAGDDGVFYTWSTGEVGPEITIYEGPPQEVSVLVENEFGCQSSDTINIGSCDVQYYFRDIPSAITPGNMDGVNDTWHIEKLNGYPRAIVEIYSRWGTLIWRSETGYSEEWNGKDLGGNDVPMDSYHFVIKLSPDTKDQITGIITVIR